MPKSAIFTRPSPVTMMFSGFRSRWTIPAGSACASAGQHALQHAGDLRQRQPPHVRPQRAARDVLHRDVRRPPARSTRTRSRCSGGSASRRAATRAGTAPRTPPSPRGSAQLLERDLPVEVGLAREVDDRHPAAADLAQDLVAPDHASLITPVARAGHTVTPSGGVFQPVIPRDCVRSRHRASRLDPAREDGR